MITLFRSAPACAVAALLSLPAAAADLAVTVEGIRSSEGRVFVAVHQPRDGVSFPGEPGMIAGAWTDAGATSFRVAFRSLSPGRYAVSVYHDENGNSQFDSNILGVPTEGYGFSNDAAGLAGPPEFDAAAVEIDSDGAAATTVTLSY